MQSTHMAVYGRGTRRKLTLLVDSNGANTLIDDLRTSLTARIAGLSARIDRIETRLDRFDERLRNVEIAFSKVDQRLLTIERILLPPREPAGE